jgi:hypothetical protein
MRTPSENNNGSTENGHAGERPTAGDDPGSSTAARKIFKVLCNPQLAVALLNAQLQIRAKAATRLPWSVRLHGRIYFRAGGDVEFGDGVSLVGTVVPIEIVSHEGSHISIGEHTFINYGASITAYREVSIGRHCLLGHHLRIIDRNEHGLEQHVAPPAAPVLIEGSRVDWLPRDNSSWS